MTTLRGARRLQPTPTAGHTASSFGSAVPRSSRRRASSQGRPLSTIMTSSCHLSKLVALSLLLLQLTTPSVLSMRWPLEGYEPGCGSLQISVSQSYVADRTAGIALDSDADVLWVLQGRTSLLKIRYSTGETLDSLDFSESGECYLDLTVSFAINTPHPPRSAVLAAIFCGEASHQPQSTTRSHAVRKPRLRSSLLVLGCSYC